MEGRPCHLWSDGKVISIAVLSQAFLLFADYNQGTPALDEALGMWYSRGFTVGLIVVWLLLNTWQHRFSGKSRCCNGTC